MDGPNDSNPLTTAPNALKVVLARRKLRLAELRGEIIEEEAEIARIDKLEVELGQSTSATIVAALLEHDVKALRPEMERLEDQEAEVRSGRVDVTLWDLKKSESMSRVYAEAQSAAPEQEDARASPSDSLSEAWEAFEKWNSENLLVGLKGHWTLREGTWTFHLKERRAASSSTSKRKRSSSDARTEPPKQTHNGTEDGFVAQGPPAISTPEANTEAVAEKVPVEEVDADEVEADEAIVGTADAEKADEDQDMIPPNDAHDLSPKKSS